MKDPTGARDRGDARLPLIGAQISTAGGFAPVPARALSLGAEVVQVFSSNPRTWRAEPPDAEGLRLFATGLREHRLPLFIHTIYLINLASPDEQLRQRSGQALAHALVTGTMAEAAGVVTHVGSHRGRGFDNAAGLVRDTVLAAFETAEHSLAAGRVGAAVHVGATQRPGADDDGRRREASRWTLPPLLLETGAGSGATIGGSLEELAALLAALPPGAGLCLDTAHLFVAGYPIHLAEGLDSLVADLRRLDLVDRVRLIHLNDSGTPFASNRDRHENPGQGQIGCEGLARVVRYPRLAPIPFVLEVPGPENRGPSATEIALVKTMRQEAPSPPAVPARGASCPEEPGSPGRGAHRRSPPSRS